MKPEDIIEYCLERYPDLVRIETWGETALFYNPGMVRKRGVYVLTIKEKDGDNDRASNLGREGVFRINFGLKKKRFEQLFGPSPKRPPAGGVVSMDVDFTVVDQLMPHPVYAWGGWVCVLSPSPETFASLEPLLDESYEYACEKFRKGR